MDKETRKLIYKLELERRSEIFNCKKELSSIKRKLTVLEERQKHEIVIFNFFLNNNTDPSIDPSIIKDFSIEQLALLAKCIKECDAEYFKFIYDPSYNVAKMKLIIDALKNDVTPSKYKKFWGMLEDPECDPRNMRKILVKIRNDRFTSEIAKNLKISPPSEEAMKRVYVYDIHKQNKSLDEVKDNNYNYMDIRASIYGGDLEDKIRFAK